MRIVALLFVVLLLAGCSTPGEDPTPTPTPSTTPAPTASPTTSATPSPTPASTPAPAPTPSPTPGGARVPEQVFTHDFHAAPETRTFRVPEGAQPTNVSVAFVPMGATGMPDCRGDARVRIVAPNGSALVDAAASANGACAQATTLAGVRLAAGEWSVRFEGSGEASAFVGIGGRGNASAGAGGKPFAHNSTHDFSQPASEDAFDVPAGAAAMNVTIAIAGKAPLAPCIATGGKVALLDPSGASQGGVEWEGTLSANPEPTRIPGPAAGTWTIAYEGTGACVATVAIEGA